MAANGRKRHCLATFFFYFTKIICQNYLLTVKPHSSKASSAIEQFKFNFTLPFNEEHLSTVCKECKQGKRGCVACKRELAAAINQYLQPFREKRSYYESHPEEVDKILEEGTKRAREKAKQTMKQVKKAMQIDYGDE